MPSRQPGGAAAAASASKGGGPAWTIPHGPSVTAMRRLPRAGGNGKPSGTMPAASPHAGRRTTRGYPACAHPATSGSPARSGLNAINAAQAGGDGFTIAWRRSTSAMGRQRHDPFGDGGRLRAPATLRTQPIARVGAGADSTWYQRFKLRGA